MFYNPVLKALLHTIHVGSFLAYRYTFLVYRQLTPEETRQILVMIPMENLIEQYEAEPEANAPTNKRNLH